MLQLAGPSYNSLQADNRPLLSIHAVILLQFIPKWTARVEQGASLYGVAGSETGLQYT